jgi:hypothetical protein
MTRLVSVTDLPCPTGRGTHHMIPLRGVMVCHYCNSTETQIREQTPSMHRADPCHCLACSRQPDFRRCRLCHLSIDVHALA